MSHGTWSNPNPRINKGTGPNDQSINTVNVAWSNPNPRINKGTGSNDQSINRVNVARNMV